MSGSFNVAGGLQEGLFVLPVFCAETCRQLHSPTRPVQCRTDLHGRSSFAFGGIRAGALLREAAQCFPVCWALQGTGACCLTMELVPCSTLPSPTACINAPPLLRCIHVVSSLLCSLKSAGEPGDLGAGGDPPRYSPTCTYLKSGEVAGWPCQLHVLFRRESRL